MIRLARIAGRSAGLALVLVSVAATAPPARAQSPCPRAIVQADSLYRGGLFAEVEQQLVACLGGATPAPVAAYRLLSLSLLRQQRLTEAQEIVVQLLAAYPDYAPDPVQDPPVYVSLVTLVERQVTPERRAPVAAAQPPLPPLEPVESVGLRQPALAASSEILEGLPRPALLETRPLPLAAESLLVEPARTFRSPGAVTLDVVLGPESYSGGQTDAGNGFADMLLRNGGLGAGLAVAVQVSNRTAVDVRVQSTDVPGAIRDGAPEPGVSPPASDYLQLDPAESSRRLASLGISLRVDRFPDRSVSPYLRLGARSVARRINGMSRVGIGPEIALGIGARVGPKAGVFGEFAVAYAVPEATVDASVFRVSSAPLIGASIGLRYLLSRLY